MSRSDLVKAFAVLVTCWGRLLRLRVLATSSPDIHGFRSLIIDRTSRLSHFPSRRPGLLPSSVRFICRDTSALSAHRLHYSARIARTESATDQKLNMEVQLYVYDLSRGMARQFSSQLLGDGSHIDAVYHTSLVFGNIEYFFGMGVQTCYPGTTHHGRPMEVIPMGETSLPIEIILEYLESLKQIYTPESYDLFAHNCNNFSVSERSSGCAAIYVDSTTMSPRPAPFEQATLT